jgi:hypothetical protein
MNKILKITLTLAAIAWTAFVAGTAYTEWPEKTRDLGSIEPLLTLEAFNTNEAVIPSNKSFVEAFGEVNNRRLGILGAHKDFTDSYPDRIEDFLLQTSVWWFSPFALLLFLHGGYNLLFASKKVEPFEPYKFGSASAATDALPVATVPNQEWIDQAYPLQQVTIKLQGTRHSDAQGIIGQLETVLARLKAGDVTGQVHDDDFGYSFKFAKSDLGPSFFKDSAGAN